MSTHELIYRATSDALYSGDYTPADVRNTVEAAIESYEQACAEDSHDLAREQAGARRRR